MTKKFQVNSFNFDIHKCAKINGKSYCKDQVTIKLDNYDMLELIMKFAYHLQSEREEKLSTTLLGYLEHTESGFLDISGTEEDGAYSEDDQLALIASHNYSMPLTLSLIYTQLLAFSIAGDMQGDAKAVAYMTEKSVEWAEIIDTVLQKNAEAKVNSGN